MRTNRVGKFSAMVGLMLVAVLILAGCGATESGQPGTLPETGSGGITDTMPFTGTSPLTDTDTMPAPTGEMTEPGLSSEVTPSITSTVGMTDEVTIELTAQNFQFDMTTIEVPAGARVLVKFTNMDNAPHNLAIYTDESLQNEIFVGETVTGPDATVTYEFIAPSDAGAYYFQCDVHPEQMTGQFIVQ